MAQRNTEAMKRLRATWMARGLCSRCGGEKSGKHRTCRYCRIAYGEAYRARFPQYTVDNAETSPHTST